MDDRDDFDSGGNGALKRAKAPKALRRLRKKFTYDKQLTAFRQKLIESQRAKPSWKFTPEFT